jgi:hypothetical protein
MLTFGLLYHMAHVDFWPAVPHAAMLSRLNHGPLQDISCALHVTEAAVSIFVCSLESLRALMTSDVKCLAVNLPHNPSGWLPSRQQWSEIVGCAREVSALVDVSSSASSLASATCLNPWPEACSTPQRVTALQAAVAHHV